MNQTLVSPCPNCGFDASKHNKVLYDGIFLICYNCSYGWYYNIEIFNPNKAISFENKSTPIKTLHTNIGYNKNNAPNRKYTRHYQPNPNKPSVNKKYNSNKIKNFTPGNIVNTSLQNKSNNSFTNKKIYYESNSNHAKNHTPNIKNTTPKISKLAFIDNKPTISENTNNSTNYLLKNNITNTSEAKKSTEYNGAKNLKFPSNNYKSNSSIALRIPQNITNIYGNPSAAKIKTNKDFKILENKKTTSSPKNECLIQNTPLKNNVENKNNYISTKPTITQVKNHINPPSKTNTNNNKTSEKSPLPKEENTNINNTPPFINTKPANKKALEERPTPSVTLDKDSIITEENLPKHNLKNTFNDCKAFNIKQNAIELNNALKNKTNMGLDNVNLLKFEERNHYNLEHFKKPFLSIKEIFNIITDFIKAIINNIFKIPQLIFTLFTRLDLLLKTFASLFLLIGTIGFLTYSYHKKQNNIKNTDIQNNEYTNETLIKDNKNLIFENNNVSGINKLNPTNNVINNNSSFKENLNIVDEKPEDKIIAFEKNLDTHSNTHKTKPKIPKHNNLDDINNETSSFLTSIKSTINNSLLSIKKIQINTFNKLKVYNNGFSLQGDYNNTLVTNVTITNSDTKNSYLIRSLEVVFLDNHSKNIGKRIIIANQLINSNSGISINLKINNPPQSTNKLFICIKDKKQI